MNRINNLLKYMKEKNIESILVTDLYNIRYLSGFTGSSAYLYISNDKNILLTDFRYIEQAGIEAPNYEIIDYTEDGLYETINNIINSDGVKNIGIEENKISLSKYNELKEELLVELCFTESIIEKLRIIKDDNEIQCLRTAESIGDKAFTHILSYIKPGVSEKDIALELEFFMKKNGATTLSFDTIVASGPHASLCHATPSEQIVKNGDMIVLDFGCIYKGYCSDMTRTVVLGSANEQQREIYNITKEAQRLALEEIRVGKVCKDIDGVARNYISDNGYGDYFGHGLGHSVGLFIHENPRFSKKDDTVLEENMVITVEPGIYLPGVGGVRIEDLVVIKKDGIENLTNSPKELIEL